MTWQFSSRQVTEPLHHRGFIYSAQHHLKECPPISTPSSRHEALLFALENVSLLQCWGVQHASVVAVLKGFQLTLYFGWWNLNCAAPLIGTPFYLRGIQHKFFCEQLTKKLGQKTKLLASFPSPSVLWCLQGSYPYFGSNIKTRLLGALLVDPGLMSSRISFTAKFFEKMAELWSKKWCDKSRRICQKLLFGTYHN